MKYYIVLIGLITAHCSITPNTFVKGITNNTGRNLTLTATNYDIINGCSDMGRAITLQQGANDNIWFQIDQAPSQTVISDGLAITITIQDTGQNNCGIQWTANFADQSYSTSIPACIPNDGSVFSLTINNPTTTSTIDNLISIGGPAANKAGMPSC